MLLLLAACSTDTTVGSMLIQINEDGGLDLTRDDGKPILHDLRFASGEGDEEIEFSSGNYRVADGSTDWTELSAKLTDDEGAAGYDLLDGDTKRGSLLIQQGPIFRVTGDGNRIRWSAACTGEDHFAGLGEHAMDVDHVGQAFALWVGEPGIGKSTDEDIDTWPLEGARHASSQPDPFLIRPEPFGLAIDADSRVEVDLCTGDRWTLDVWDPATTFTMIDGDTPREVVEQHTLRYGLPPEVPDWVFAPWNDAVGGEARVRDVASKLRAAGAPSSVIWTEDWKGGEETAFGYRIKPEWQVDTTLYPDAAGIDADLEAMGFKWFAYFSPFVSSESSNWQEAQELLIRTADGEPYTFVGASLVDESVLDLSRDDAVLWAQTKIRAAMDLGFDGWMADFAEWLPTDAVLAHADALDDHNRYPLWWQSLNLEVIDGKDASWFSRSGWAGSTALSPMHWPGDQRTSFETDDGYPTVVPLMIGDGLAGVLLTGSDIAGYQSIGNAPSTEELWFRWCSLGAFSPLMRTHHGAFLADNWQFDTTEETTAHFARYAQVHAALYPYLRGLYAQARNDGTPLVRPIFLDHPDEDWGRTDAYLFGDLLVAPVLTEGAASRDVDLPGDVQWFDWWTGAAATSGSYAAPVDSIPVFAPAGAIIPLHDVVVDTLVDGPIDGLVTRSDADGSREIRVYAGKAGSFTEADGTTYSSDGVATGSGTATGSFSSGSLSAGGLTLDIEGVTTRSYTLVVVN